MRIKGWIEILRCFRQQSRILAIVLFIVSAGIGALVWPRHSVTPSADALFTSTRYITAIAVDDQSAVWASTLGGVIRVRPDGRFSRWSRTSGLPSNEVFGLKVDAHQVVATCPTAEARFDAGHWVISASDGVRPKITCEATWRGKRYAAAADQLLAIDGKKIADIALPHSSGTHVSALMANGETLWAALFGDGIWAFDGVHWTRVSISLPPGSEETTALAACRGALWIGTRRTGLWEVRNEIFRSWTGAQEPMDHNCQALCLFQGRLMVSTLDQGLIVRSDRGWGHFKAQEISSDAPRQMVEFRGKLYLRHGSGKLDSWDGSHWSRNIAAELPRRQISALGADGERLYAAQWGGWSEFDGDHWIHHFDLPDLQGLAITAICPIEGRLWLGTQRRGLAEYDRNDHRLIWHDERDGLKDDWITAIAPQGSFVAAGTFVGGLSLVRRTTQPATKAVGVLTPAQFISATDSSSSALPGENVTALEKDSNGGLFVGTRTGLWEHTESGLRRIELAHGLPDAEVQCLCHVPGGLWIGTRTGLYFRAGI